MNIQTITRHLRTLGKVSGEFEIITNYLIQSCKENPNKVKELDIASYKMKLKDILLEWCYDNSVSITYKDLNLLHFLNPTFGILTIDFLKLDAWLYNKLLDVYGHKIHDMSGAEKLLAYCDNDKTIKRWTY